MKKTKDVIITIVVIDHEMTDQQRNQPLQPCTIWLIVYEDEYETWNGDGLYYHYRFAFGNEHDAIVYCQSRRGLQIFGATLLPNNTFVGLPWCKGWDGTLDPETVRADAERPRAAKAMCDVFMEELMQVVWHPTGRMFQYFMEDDEV